MGISNEDLKRMNENTTHKDDSDSAANVPCSDVVMCADTLQRHVARLSNSGFVRHWLHWNYPQETPWIMAIECRDNNGLVVKVRDLIAEGYVWCPKEKRHYVNRETEELKLKRLLYAGGHCDIPKEIAACPECEGPLHAECDEWEADTGRPITVLCVCAMDDDSNHRMWQSDWQPTLDRVQEWARS